jgi:hypothetical protein
MSLKQNLVAIPLLACVLGGYAAAVGFATDRAAAASIEEFSRTALLHWRQIAAGLQLGQNQTKPGGLAPLVRDQFSALDLVVFGAKLVKEEYRQAYEVVGPPSLIGKVFTTVDEKGHLKYVVGGVRPISLQSDPGNGDAIFFMDTPYQFIDALNRQYDRESKSGGDNSGQIRYGRMPDGRLVLGFYPQASREVASK